MALRTWSASDPAQHAALAGRIHGRLLMQSVNGCNPGSKIEDSFPRPMPLLTRLSIRWSTSRWLRRGILEVSYQLGGDDRNFLATANIELDSRTSSGFLGRANA